MAIYIKTIEMPKSDGIRGNLRIFLEYAMKDSGYDVGDLS